MIYDASDEAKKQTAFATSEGLPGLLSGISSIRFLIIFSGNFLVIGVEMSPGITTLTLTLNLASSRAAVLVKAIRPAFDAA